MTKKAQSSVSAFVVHGDSCDADIVFCGRATAKSVLAAARALGAVYEAHGSDAGFRMWVEIDGIKCDLSEISIISPMIGARALIEKCRTRALHASMNAAISGAGGVTA